MRRFILIVIALKLAFLIGSLTLFVSSQSASETQIAPTPTPVVESSDRVTRPTSDPYSGDLSIFEDADRAKNLQIDRVMDLLKISEKKVVADIGAGSGWFTMRAAERTKSGTVYAVEINQKYIDHINRRAKRERLSNIKTILGKPDDPLLSPDSIDVVMILKTYHEIAQPIALMRKIKSSLKKGGLVGIIDRNGTGSDHGLDREKVEAELKLAGFSLKDGFDFVKADGMDYFLIFEIAK